VIVEAMRLLKAGGHCIISVPFDVPPSLWRPLFFIQVVFQGYLLGNPYYRGRCGHVNSFSVESITKAFQRRGFIVESAFVMRKLTIFLSARKPGTIGAFSRSWEDVTVILPTLNEEKNISGIINRLVADYPGCEIIVSDDGSTDKTKERVSDLPHSKITFLDRSKKDVHGLTVSVLDAVDLVKTKYFIVMDADGQHPSEKVGDMVNILRCGASLVVASRVEVEQGWGVLRRLISYCGTLLGKTVLIGRSKNFLTFDVLGGFFGCNTLFWQDSIPESVKRTRFRLKGYKVLFDFLKYAPASVDIEEVYYRFETRKAEISKINPKVYWEYLMSCLTP
jgi:dolichol-phosphate mannosyltransferase